MWAALALALLTKGLIAPVFFFAAAVPLLLLSGQWRRWRALKPFSGMLLFLLIAAPWHILAGLANPDQGHPVGNHPTIGNVHGFWYFYFLNEHVFRFLARASRTTTTACPSSGTGPRTWCGFSRGVSSCPRCSPSPGAPATCWLQHLRRDAGQTVDFYLDYAQREDVASYVQRLKFRVRSAWLLGLYSAFILLFFSFSTNQEYYTFPAWPALLMLIAGVIADRGERARLRSRASRSPTAWLTGAARCVFASSACSPPPPLGWGLWESRQLPFVADIGTLLAHREVGDYTLSMSHLFDLTGPSFAALRLPAILAAVTLLLGPAVSWWLRLKHRHLAATTTLALTCGLFLVAAHIAFARFEPMLSSKPMADTIRRQGLSARPVHHLRRSVRCFLRGLLYAQVPEQARRRGL